MKRREMIIVFWLLAAECIMATNWQVDWALSYTAKNVTQHVVRLAQKGEWNPHALVIRALLRTYGPYSD